MSNLNLYYHPILSYCGWVEVGVEVHVNLLLRVCHIHRERKRERGRWEGNYS